MTSSINAIEIIADSAHGQYIPQYAAECLAAEWSGLSAETRELLKAGPEHDFYWETWETVLNNAEYTDENGNTWRLHHEGDLFAVCDKLMSAKQYAEFYGEDKPLDNFTRHYLIAMLWSSTDESGEHMDANYDISDLAPETLQAAIDDCAAFQRENAELLALAYEHYVDSGMAAHPDAGSPQACAGHDFWLTRCGHGVGFWDRGMPGDTGERLSEAARRTGERWPYIGDDGRVYFA